jgi:hypothetical protein
MEAKMDNNHKPAEMRRLLLHYLHALFWVTLVFTGVLRAARSVWGLQLTPFVEIVLVAVWLAAPVPLAIRDVGGMQTSHQIPMRSSIFWAF